MSSATIDVGTLSIQFGKSLQIADKVFDIKREEVLKELHKLKCASGNGAIPHSLKATCDDAQNLLQIQVSMDAQPGMLATRDTVLNTILQPKTLDELDKIVDFLKRWEEKITLSNSTFTEEITNLSIPCNDLKMFVKEMEELKSTSLDFYNTLNEMEIVNNLEIEYVMKKAQIIQAYKKKFMPKVFSIRNLIMFVRNCKTLREDAAVIELNSMPPLKRTRSKESVEGVDAIPALQQHDSSPQKYAGSSTNAGSSATASVQKVVQEDSQKDGDKTSSNSGFFSKLYL